ncbi:hypothetical protein LR48_Vigan09g095400 [Vigna angularis]|uniref:Uncharacterized protein n=1 Tax=Phaseolus angularis TaxID=3914 RepID=A0A0L9VB53_PHAAN|nr:hypothetical protein LR48_Vigan09g095400 [Vigna angularis]
MIGAGEIAHKFPYGVFISKFFTDEQIAFNQQTDFEKYVVNEFRKTFERVERVEKTLFRLEKKGDVLNKNGIGSKTEDSDDESTDEDSMESS